MDNRTSQAQIKASRNYEKRNKEKTRINSYKRTARLFVKTYATDEDMKELLKIYEENKNKR
jgi:putative phage-associated protein|nr:MAG TPA: hypothetical protein [Caudoviricetes sp.]DAN62991.1 MAG TPA: hypothetical protein [Caudoviricetes sp.]